MDHVAILRKSSGLLEKILSGEKKIESRWYTARFAPWGQISEGDTIYFKYAGMPVEARATVKKVRQFSGLTSERVKALWEKYGRRIGVNNIESYVENTKHKKYCILIGLEKVQRLPQPFVVDKTGFGNACAWLVVGSISVVRGREVSRDIASPGTKTSRKK